MAEDENIISLPSSLNYRHLNNYRYDLYGDDMKCDQLQDDLKKRHLSIENFCLKLTGILKKFDNLEITSLSNNDRCSVVIYWMYDTIFKDIIDKKVYDDILPVIGYISNIWQHVHEEKKCPFRGNLTDKGVFYKMKMLYYYGIDYDSIVAQKSNLLFECTEDYSSYIKAYVQTYNDIEGECKGNSSPLYCSVLEEIKRIKNKNDLSKLEICTPLPKEGHEDRSEMGDHNSKEEEAETSYAPSTSGSKVGLPVVFSLLGILFISSIFYKFTPFGPWIRSHVLKNVNESYDVGEEETENILESSYEFSNINSSSNGHNIGYQSVENF
ncbi:PIR Superfamily Protein [Plasmodium ovale wallikeri]|uniref:PIR protein n=2 Tax=Plasmodium ovale TaxID=36330 RepID=A0A1C3KG22_PLAOA|nr:PIR Superfamily Protein [Plasmodium ovale wallikeri]SBT72627.1 PIR protein [Plasmodium ovale]